MPCDDTDRPRHDHRSTEDSSVEVVVEQYGSAVAGRIQHEDPAGCDGRAVSDLHHEPACAPISPVSPVSAKMRSVVWERMAETRDQLPVRSILGADPVDGATNCA
jgi:hypothetical protein